MEDVAMIGAASHATLERIALIGPGEIKREKKIGR